MMLSAQPYQPLLDSVNIWHYVNSPITVRLEPPSTIASAPCQYAAGYYSSKFQYTTYDTVIGLYSYKVVMEEMDLNPNPCHFGYVREDTATRRVYFLDNAGNPEILLYDFSLQVNDTFSVSFLQNNYYQSGVFEVDSIIPFSTGYGTTRLFCLSNPSSPWNTLYWAEGVGCLLNAFYPYASNMMGGFVFWSCTLPMSQADEFLSCFEHTQKMYYDSCRFSYAATDQCFQVTDSCNYFNICGAIAENKINAEVELFPMPAHESLNVKFESQESETFTFVVYDVNGKSVLTDIAPLRSTGSAQTFTVNITSLAPGNYILQCNSASGQLGVPFVIE